MDLSVYLPPGAKNLVEFGCGSGEMGRSFKRIVPFCRYVGVEKNAALAQEARAHLDEAVTADAADVAFEEGDEVDCLVYHSGFLPSSDGQGTLREHAAHVSCGGGQLYSSWRTLHTFGVCFRFGEAWIFPQPLGRRAKPWSS